jgi:hypothetical protein
MLRFLLIKYFTVSTCELLARVQQTFFVKQERKPSQRMVKLRSLANVIIKMRNRVTNKKNDIPTIC